MRKLVAQNSYYPATKVVGENTEWFWQTKVVAEQKSPIGSIPPEPISPPRFPAHRYCHGALIEVTSEVFKNVSITSRIRRRKQS